MRCDFIRWTPTLTLLAALGCGAPGGSDDATVVPDSKAGVVTKALPDGPVEVPSPAPSKSAP